MDRGVMVGRLWAPLVVIWVLLVPQLAGAVLQGRLNLNEATIAGLELLPDIGAVRARAIVEYRERHGRFTSLEELTEVTGIGPRTLTVVRPYLKLTGVSDLRDTAAPIPGAPRPPEPATRPGSVLLVPDQSHFDALIQHLDGARSRVDIAMFVFKVGDGAGNRPAQIVRTLGAARQRGVKVRVVLERDDRNRGLNRDNEAAAAALRSVGVEVRFDRPETTSHMKLVVIDGRYSFVGSHNLTQSALRYNHEISLLVDDPILAGSLLRYLDGIVAP